MYGEASKKKKEVTCFSQLALINLCVVTSVKTLQSFLTDFSFLKNTKITTSLTFRVIRTQQMYKKAHLFQAEPPCKAIYRMITSVRQLRNYHESRAILLVIPDMWTRELRFFHAIAVAWPAWVNYISWASRHFLALKLVSRQSIFKISLSIIWYRRSLKLHKTAK